MLEAAILLYCTLVASLYAVRCPVSAGERSLHSLCPRGLSDEKNGMRAPDFAGVVQALVARTEGPRKYAQAWMGIAGRPVDIPLPCLAWRGLQEAESCSWMQ